MVSRAVLGVMLCASAVAVRAEPPHPAEELVAAFHTRGSYLGVGVAEVDAGRAKALSLKEERGVEITRVEDDGPAGKAGLKVGDVVLDYNGTRVEGTDQFMRLVRETPVGRDVKLQVSRSGAPQTITVRTVARKAWFGRGGEGFVFATPEFSMPEVRIPDIPKAYLGWRSPRLGIEGESLEGQLATYFGVDEGVLVRSVIKGTAAERAGIRAGDVILKIDDQSVTSTREISSVLNNSRSSSKKSVPVLLTREKKQMTISVTLEDEKGDQVRFRDRRTVARRL